MIGPVFGSRGYGDINFLVAFLRVAIPALSVLFAIKLVSSSDEVAIFVGRMRWLEFTVLIKKKGLLCQFG